MPKNDLAQLLKHLAGKGTPVTLDLTPPPIQDPVKGGMKKMTPEGHALMKFLQAMGANVGPEDLHEDTEDVLDRIPHGRVITDKGDIGESV